MADRAPIAWKGWMGWVAATIVGALLVVLIVYFGFPLAEAFTATAKSGLPQHLLEALSLGIAGTAFATVQWIWLRRSMSQAGWWVPATVLSWYVAIGLEILLTSLPLDRLGAKLELAARISALCLIAFTANLPQWYLVRRAFFGAGYWLLARPLGWLAGFGLVLLAERLGIITIPVLAFAELFGRSVPDLAVWSFGALLFGLVHGAITGAALVLIWRKPKPVLAGQPSWPSTPPSPTLP